MKAHREYLSALATFLVSDDGPDDLPRAVEEIAAAGDLDAEDVTALAQMLDLCPFHLCDAEICADDDAEECAEWREEGRSLTPWEKVPDAEAIDHEDGCPALGGVSGACSCG